jgi:hypothetical protein
MENLAKLLTAVATVLSAIAWPSAFVGFAYLFRNELRPLFGKLVSMLDRVKKASLPGVAFELDRVADTEASVGIEKHGEITPRQVEAAARIQAQDIDTNELLRELDTLCIEFDSIRRTLPPSVTRTRAMGRVLIKMRSLAPSLVESIDLYKGSGSWGSRLAAIAMMQMVPRVADLSWLEERFSADPPYLFYHAALAIQNVANFASTSEEKAKVREVARRSLATVRAFDGTPDENTIKVLEALLSSLPAR